MTDLRSAPASSRKLELDPRRIASDRQLFHAFVKETEKAVFAVLFRMLGPSAPVEDLAQEAYMRAFRALPDFDQARGAKLSTWLLTIAVRLAIDHRRVRQLLRDERSPDEVVGFPPAEEGHLQRELGSAIQRAVEALPEDQRDVFILAEYNDWSHAEIAEALSTEENTVKTRLFRARAKLRITLSEWRTP